SAWTLRSARGIARGQRARTRRSARAARFVRAQRTPGGLPNERTRRSARAHPAGRAGAARARCARGVPARRRHRATRAPAAAAGIGHLGGGRRPAVGALAIAILAAALLPSPRAFAQTNEEQALRSTLETRLAYVITGDAEVDRVSKAGLQGLTLFLAQRTALE